MQTRTRWFVVASVAASAVGSVLYYVAPGAALSESARGATVTQIALTEPPVATRMSTQLDSLPLSFRRGTQRLSLQSKLQLERFTATALAADAIEIHGSEPRGKNFTRARKTAFVRAFAVRSFLADRGVDPRKARIFYHTLGRALQPGVDVRTSRSGP